VGTTKKNIAFSKKHQELAAALGKGLEKVAEKLIAETKEANGYLVVADKNGKAKKVAAKDV
jgi:hypothetical protein